MIDRPQVDYTGIPVFAYLLLQIYVLHHQSLFLLGVNFEGHGQNAEVRSNMVRCIRKFLVPCEGRNSIQAKINAVDKLQSKLAKKVQMIRKRKQNP